MTRRSKGIALLAALLVGSGSAWAQGSAGTGATIEPRYAVDRPTAGILATGAFALDAEVEQDGGLLLGIQYGLFDRFTFGISYGGSGLVGGGETVMNPLPGVTAKFRFVHETTVLPAIALGFDSQGKNGYDRELDRYRVKSPGLYAVASKNWELLGNLTLHAGMNYSFERADDDRDLNFTFAAEKSAGPWASLLLEYDLARNDSRDAVGKGTGYLNAGLAFSPTGGLTLFVYFKDLLENGQDVEVANRTLRLEYVWGN